jgi:hypothetical protein
VPRPRLGLAEWLCLAATPTFAILALLTGLLGGSLMDSSVRPGLGRRCAEGAHVLADPRHRNEPKKGDHFAAFKQPTLFTQELRECFRRVRGA